MESGCVEGVNLSIMIKSNVIRLGLAIIQSGHWDRNRPGESIVDHMTQIMLKNYK